jgi:hypothetical protein
MKSRANKQSMELAWAFNTFNIAPLISKETVPMTKLKKVFLVNLTLTDGIKELVCT